MSIFWLNKFLNFFLSNLNSKFIEHIFSNTFNFSLRQIFFFRVSSKKINDGSNGRWNINSYSLGLNLYIFSSKRHCRWINSQMLSLGISFSDISCRGLLANLWKFWHFRQTNSSWFMIFWSDFWSKQSLWYQRRHCSHWAYSTGESSSFSRKYFLFVQHSKSDSVCYGQTSSNWRFFGFEWEDNSK